MSGRKFDKVWLYFNRQTRLGKTAGRAICKKCGKDIQGLVKRMKQHLLDSNPGDPEEIQVEDGTDLVTGMTPAQQLPNSQSSSSLLQRSASAAQPKPCSPTQTLQPKKIKLENFVVLFILQLQTSMPLIYRLHILYMEYS